jgi:D-arabinose 1-dehydrogenase-like Zn-dependent alcohol dehydrogenase
MLAMTYPETSRVKVAKRQKPKLDQPDVPMQVSRSAVCRSDVHRREAGPGTAKQF